MAGETGKLNVTRRSALASLLAAPLAGCWERGPATPKTSAKVQAKADHQRGLTELVDLDQTIQLDIRYATINNFTGRKLYDQPRAFLVRTAAEALQRAHHAAQDQGYGLTIFDAYRPWRVTKALWEATPPGPKRNYVANPKRGSKHNRGCAVDLTLHDLATGALVEMPSGYDEFTFRAHRGFTGAPAKALANRDLLQRLMEAQSFRGASNEWWHFDFAGWHDYPVMDTPFEDLI